MGRRHFRGVRRGRAREVGKPKRAEGPDRVKHPGSRKGHGFSGGMKPLKHRCEVVRFRKEVQERRGEGKPFYDHLGGEKL